MGNVRRTEECKQNVSKKTARSDHLERLYVARWIILRAKDNSTLTQSGPQHSLTTLMQQVPQKAIS